jgi:hypothetical protein
MRRRRLRKMGHRTLMLSAHQEFRAVADRKPTSVILTAPSAMRLSIRPTPFGAGRLRHRRQHPPIAGGASIDLSAIGPLTHGRKPGRES